ncbi:unnamed protein product [Anisakis simplex]|uniref:Segment polarity protein dishevelled (inferred by orthology to a D. melanogaster protein) n=1 Tax=Anisakis simplex TaxID=6269 RepID=A0A0M3JFU4_ANISI|nr:unnamed protein product [Anisakis simplex]
MRRLPATITTNIIGNHSDSSTSNPTTKTGADAATTEVTYVGSPAPPHQAQKRLLAVTQNVIGCIGNSNSNASGNSSNNNNNNNQALQKQFLTPLSNNNNMNMATGIDQTWPLSPIAACGQTGQSSGQRRDDRDSPVVSFSVFWSFHPSEPVNATFICNFLHDHLNCVMITSSQLTKLIIQI